MIKMNKTELIRQLIKDTNLTMKAFAQKADIPYTTLRSMLERGIENASVNNVIKVCSTLNISIEYLYHMQDINSLSYDETELLRLFNELNDIGRKELLKRIAELTQITSYRKSMQICTDEICLGMAAHNDHAHDPEQQKLMKEDLDEL